MSMNNIALCSQLFCELDLVIIQEARIRHDNERDRDPESVEDGARTFENQMETQTKIR